MLEGNAMNCPSCDSTNIEKGVSIGKSAETGNVGQNLEVVCLQALHKCIAIYA